MLVVLGLLKLFTTSLLLATGWKGGYIFPIMFAGVALGMAINLIFPAIPVAVTVAATMAGALVAALKAPLFAALFTSTLVQVETSRRVAARYRRGRLRFVLEPVTFDELLGAAFDMLRHANCDNASVLLHMLDVIAVIGRETIAPAARCRLCDHVSLIQVESQAGNLIEEDRQAIDLRGPALQTELAGAP